MELKRVRQQIVLASVFAASLGMTSAAFAEHLRGVISQHHDDGTLLVQADDSANVIVVVAVNTKVRRQDGLRSSKMSSASLVPVLRIEADGQFGDANRFIAEKVTFKKSDLKTARAIHGGLGPTDLRVAANEQRIAQQET